MNPPGFNDEAVASSQTAIKAPAIPISLAPEPTGLKDDGNSNLTYEKIGAGKKMSKQLINLKVSQ